MVELHGKIKALSSVCYCRKKTHYTSNMAAATLGTPDIFKIAKISIEKLQPRIQGASKMCCRTVLEEFLTSWKQGFLIRDSCTRVTAWN